MDVVEFEASLRDAAPPAGLGRPLRALWHAARDEWERAHALVQEAEGEPSHDWVHAHLHRIEGDLGNAAYWYRRSGRPVARGDLASERRVIVATLIAA